MARSAPRERKGHKRHDRQCPRPAHYYAANISSSGYGLFTTPQAIGATVTSASQVSSNVGFVITGLVQGWANSTIPNVGKMMLLGNYQTDSGYYFQYADWGSSVADNSYSSADGPTITITTIPEPSTLAMLVTALLGLVCYAWRKRR